MTTSATGTARPAPALRGAPLVGSALALRRDHLGTLLRAAREVGDVARIDAGPPGMRVRLLLVATPEGAAHVLAEQPEDYRRGTRAYVEIRRAFGEGLLTSEGEEWRRQRHALAPVFTRRRLTTAYAAVMAEEAALAVRRWREPAAAGRAVDAHAEMVRVAARVVGRVLFGADVEDGVTRISAIARHVNAMLLRRAVVPRFLPAPGGRRYATGVRTVHEVVDEIVSARRALLAAAPGADPGEDLLGLLLADEDPARPGREVADQVLIFLLAGHETTATTLACALVELARSPDVQGRVAAEVDAVLRGRQVSADDVPLLVETGRVVRESLRLYPPAHTVGRLAVRDDVVGGYAVPAGSVVLTSPWVVHRSPRLWPDPDRFDPSRFAEEAGQPVGGSRYAWFPFGAGPHTCIGQQFAMLEAPMVLATVLQAYRLTTDVGEIAVEAGATLRPSRPLPVRLVPR